MARFARVLDGKVIDVIIADMDYVMKYRKEVAVHSSTMTDSNVARWIETTAPGDGVPMIRKHCAAVGYHYDEELDAFYEPKQYPSWSLNTETCEWEAPVPKPDNLNKWQWNEENQQWDWVKKYVDP